MLRLAIVGLGKIGLLHSAILGARPDVELVAACERKGVVRHFGKSALPQVRLVKEVGDLAGLSLDAVYVATLPGSHHAVVREVLEGGIARHVFVEKSMAASHAQALEMCRLADAHGGAHMIGFQKRFSNMFRKTRELVQSGAIGEVVGFDSHAYSSDFAHSGSDQEQAVSRGGVMRDQGSHSVDLALWLFGELTPDAATADPQAATRPPDFTFGAVTTEGGAKGTFSVSAMMADYRLPEIGMRITGRDGTIDVNDDRLELVNGDVRRWHRQDLDDSRVSFLLGDPEYTRETDAFLRAVAEGGEHGGADFRDGARAEAVIDGIMGVRS